MVQVMGPARPDLGPSARTCRANRAGWPPGTWASVLDGRAARKEWAGLWVRSCVSSWDVQPARPPAVRPELCPPPPPSQRKGRREGSVCSACLGPTVSRASSTWSCCLHRPGGAPTGQRKRLREVERLAQRHIAGPGRAALTLAWESGPRWLCWPVLRPLCARGRARQTSSECERRARRVNVIDL